MMAATIWLNKSNLSEYRVHEEALPVLGDGEVRLRVESFAVTANNITYAVIGDMFRYWDFFPAQATSPDRDDGATWGIVPMWGHAVVEASNHPEISESERVYGYLPMGTHLDILPGNISRGQITDMATHRQPMSIFYNQYSRLAADPEHNPAREAQRMIFGPLFKTGFLIETMFRNHDWFGAKALVMTSASSKTAMALAHCARQMSPAIERIALTSAGNVAFVEKSGLYDKVIAYDDVAALPDGAAVAVDFAGNAALLRRIHEHYSDQLKYSCLVGATHVEGRGGGGAPLPGPAPILFFAPEYATAAIKAVGAKAFAATVAASWNSFVSTTDDFVSVDLRHGVTAAADAFQTVLAGAGDPATGIVIRP